MKSELLLQIPYGTRDFLPEEAARKRAIETSLADTFGKWGYDEVVTPAIEFLDTLMIGGGYGVKPYLFKFFDKNNQTLALRHEMTTPIARVAASRLSESETPLKLSYIAGVYRHEQAQRGRQCEFYQAGVELMGASNASADAEVVALAIEGLLGAGLSDFRISLGQVDFINGVMAQEKLSLKEQSRMKAAMVNRNLVELEDLIARSSMTKNAKAVIAETPLLVGREELLRRAYQMVYNEQSKRALDNLSEIYRLLQAYGVEKYVNFDLGVIRDFDYYTGMVFEVYTPGLGFPLCGGGRYDHLLSKFGVACPATGFALGIERIMLALKRQNADESGGGKDMYIAWSEGNIARAIAEARKRRQSGNSVELALCAQERTQAEKYRLSRGFRQLIYLD